MKVNVFAEPAETFMKPNFTKKIKMEPVILVPRKFNFFPGNWNLVRALHVDRDSCESRGNFLVAVPFLKRPFLLSSL